MTKTEGLNDQQKDAVKTINGPVLILAGAGSGKTRTITYRIAHMIKDCGISPHEILAVTFTNKSAKEMKDRVEKLIEEDGKKVSISTFHSFGVSLLREYADEIGYDSNFTIFDSDDQKKIIKKIFKKRSLADKKITEFFLASSITKLKESGLSKEEYLKKKCEIDESKIIGDVYSEYNDILKSNNSMDFSDILNYTYDLLKNHEVLEKISEKYKYIMVDEYQDTNDIQYKIINTIAKKHGNLCVVGDENQSIYGFRGANIKNILNFEKDYPTAKVIKLEENFRSTSNILKTANSVIINNSVLRDKKLWTNNIKGEKITIQQFSDEKEEADYVVKTIKKLNESLNIPLKDFAILYRNNYQSRHFEEAFLKNNIKYQLFGGGQFYQRPEIKVLLNYLTFIKNPKDSLSLSKIINVPKKNIGDKNIEKILDFAKRKKITAFEAVGRLSKAGGLGPTKSIKLEEFYNTVKDLVGRANNFEKISDILNKLILEINYVQYLKSNYPQDYEEKIKNVENFIYSICEIEKLLGRLTIREYLENVSLVNSTDSLDENEDFVRVMTIHNSKGLEFPIVFLTGVEDEIFPGRTTLVGTKRIEEERRLMYVAITRAEKKLIITHSNLRSFPGGIKCHTTMSRFISEIPQELLYSQVVLVEELDDENNVPNNVVEECEQNIFKIGEKVFHTRFGNGVVKNTCKLKITVIFKEGEKQIATSLSEKFLTKKN